MVYSQEIRWWNDGST